MGELLSNQILWTAIVANAAAQLLKGLLVKVLDRRGILERVFGSGGMPSSHSAFVSALATGVGIREGLGSPLFAATTVFALITMYDAAGVRRSAGEQAHVLNELVSRLGHVFDEGFRPETLRTLLGHTYMQVLAGMVLGIGVALISFRSSI
jgi:uncharacterized protein